MPYNNTPIAPPTENQYTGETKLPLARVKKIIASDDDIGPCSANAAFAITIATEMFVQYLVDQTQTIVKAEKRPRRSIAYRDVAGAVAKYDNLDFLVDVVPRQTTYRAYTQRRAQLARKPATVTAPQLAPVIDDDVNDDDDAMDVDKREGQPDAGGAAAAATVLESPRSAGTRFDVVSEEIKPPGDADED